MTDDRVWYKDPFAYVRYFGLFFFLLILIAAFKAPASSGPPVTSVTYQTNKGKMVCEKITGADPRETRLNCSLPTPTKVTK